MPGFPFAAASRRAAVFERGPGREACDGAPQPAKGDDVSTVRAAWIAGALAVAGLTGVDSSARQEQNENMSARKFFEDNYRIEVDHRDGRTEVILKSSDWAVMQCGWHAAVRRRPGLTLRQYNGDHLTGDMVAPGVVLADDKVDGHADLRLSDLREWHLMRAFCDHCGNGGDISIDSMRRTFGTDAFIGAVERRLACKRCEARRSARIEIRNMPR